MTPSGPQISVIRGMSCLIIVSPWVRRRSPPGCPGGCLPATPGPGSLPRRGPGGAALVSGHPLVGGQGEELGIVVGQGHLGEQGGGLVVPSGVEGPAEGRRNLAQLLADDLLDQVAGHLRAV